MYRAPPCRECLFSIDNTVWTRRRIDGIIRADAKLRVDDNNKI